MNETTERAVALRGTGELAAYSADQADVMQTLRNSLYPGASWASIDMVLAWCRVNEVDPFLKPVHIVPMSVKKPGTNSYEWRDVLMPGIADYRIKAARSGQYIGKSEPIFGPMVEYNLDGVLVTVPEFCTIVVRRLVAGQIAEFSATEYWLENYATAKRDTRAPNSMWQRRARGQLAKCAEAQALRMAFPELSGDITAEEMEGKSFDHLPAHELPPMARGASKLETLANVGTLPAQDEAEEPHQEGAHGAAPDQQPDAPADGAEASADKPKRKLGDVLAELGTKLAQAKTAAEVDEIIASEDAEKVTQFAKGLAMERWNAMVNAAIERTKPPAEEDVFPGDIQE